MKTNQSNYPSKTNFFSMNLSIHSQKCEQKEGPSEISLVEKTMRNICSAIKLLGLLLKLIPSKRRRDRLKNTIRKSLIETIEKTFQ